MLEGFFKLKKLEHLKAQKLIFAIPTLFLLNSRLRFSFGTAIGIQQMGIDVSNMKLFDNNDPLVDISRISYLFPNFSVGLLLSNKNNFIGLSVKQLFENNWNTHLNSDLSKNKSSFIIIGGKKFKVSDFIFSPIIMTTFKSEIKPIFLLGFQVDYKEVFGFGLYIKNENLFTSQIKINISKKIKVSYAHDVLISTFLNSTLNSGELMIIFNHSLREKLNRNNQIIYF